MSTGSDSPSDVKRGHTSTSKVEHYAPEGPIYFYGGVFSNFVGGPFRITWTPSWWPTVGLDPGIPAELVYTTIEHFYQAAKAKTGYQHARVQQANSPGQAKGRGRKVDLRPDWEEVKYEVMLIGLRVKFAPNGVWHEYLMATGDRLLAEDSPTDFIWGIRDAKGGFGGQNLLGKALMQVRDELREGVNA